MTRPWARRQEGQCHSTLKHTCRLGDATTVLCAKLAGWLAAAFDKCGADVPANAVARASPRCGAELHSTLLQSASNTSNVQRHIIIIDKLGSPNRNNGFGLGSYMYKLGERTCERAQRLKRVDVAPVALSILQCWKQGKEA